MAWGVSMIPRSKRVANGMLGCFHRSMVWYSPFDVSAGFACGAILSGTLLKIITHFPFKQFEDSRVANVFLPERGFIFRNGDTSEIGARSFEPGRAILVRIPFRRPLIAAGATVNEIIGIGGQFGHIKRLQDTRIVLIALAEQGHILRDSVAFEIEALGVELRGAGDAAFRQRLPALRAARRAGVVMPTVCLISDHFIGDFEAARRRDALANMQTLLSAIAELGGYGAVTPASYGMHSNSLPPFIAPRAPEEDRGILLESLGVLAVHAEREGVCVLLEPLNRYGDHMLNRLEQAAELCQAVGMPSLKIVGDFYHMNIEERDLAAAIRSAAGYLKHMHLADSNRLPPGYGHIDFAPAFEALRASGFDGYLALECAIEGDPRSALAAAARYIQGQ